MTLDGSRSSDPEGGDLVRDFLREDLLESLGDELAEPVDGAFLNGNYALRQADAVYRIRTRFGSPEYAYVVIEHKSSRDRRTPKQILHYILGIWDRIEKDQPGRRGKLPPVYVMVFYHGDGAWDVPTTIVDQVDWLEGDAQKGGWERYQLVDLRLKETVERARNPSLRAALNAMRLAFGKEEIPPEELAETLENLPDDKSLQEIAVVYLSRRCKNSEEEFEDILRRVKPKNWSALMETVADHYINEGIAKGIAKGKAEGKAEGQANILLRLLEHRFGALTDKARARVLAGNPTQFDRWAVRVLDASSLDEVFAPET